MLRAATACYDHGSQQVGMMAVLSGSTTESQRAAGGAAEGSAAGRSGLCIRKFDADGALSASSASGLDADVCLEAGMANLERNYAAVAPDRVALMDKGDVLGKTVQTLPFDGDRVRRVTDWQTGHAHALVAADAERCARIYDVRNPGGRPVLSWEHAQLTQPHAGQMTLYAVRANERVGASLCAHDIRYNPTVLSQALTGRTAVRGSTRTCLPGQPLRVGGQGSIVLYQYELDDGAHGVRVYDMGRPTTGGRLYCADLLVTAPSASPPASSADLRVVHMCLSEVPGVSLAHRNVVLVFTQRFMLVYLMAVVREALDGEDGLAIVPEAVHDLARVPMRGGSLAAGDALLCAVVGPDHIQMAFPEYDSVTVALGAGIFDDDA